MWNSNGIFLFGIEATLKLMSLKVSLSLYFSDSSIPYRLSDKYKWSNAVVQSVNDDKALTRHKSHRTLMVKGGLVLAAVQKEWEFEQVNAFRLSTKHIEYFMESHSHRGNDCDCDWNDDFYWQWNIIYLLFVVVVAKIRFEPRLSWSKNEWTSAFPFRWKRSALPCTLVSEREKESKNQNRHRFIIGMGSIYLL